MVGRHTVVLEGGQSELERYIAEELLRVRMVVDGEEEAEAALPAE